MGTTGVSPETTHRRHGVNLVRVANPAELAARAEDLVATAAHAAIAQRGRFVLALAGGSTPRLLYERLAHREGVDWPRWNLYWGDERCVPPDHADSNFGMVTKTLLQPLAARGVEPGAVARMQGEIDPHAAAAAYDALLHTLGAGVTPRFDLILLGMGSDGHTASLFPHTPALSERERLAAANPVEKLHTMRLTVTLPLINAARSVLFLVAGPDKATALADVLGDQRDADRWPSQAVQPHAGDVTWLVDTAAASMLPSES